MKRFYKNVHTTENTDGGYIVLLDEKTVRTPLHNPLILSTKQLAETIAEEWQAQDDILDMNTMPITQLAFTCQDKIATQKDTVIKTLVPYLETELICYPSPEPPELYEKQKSVWRPLMTLFQNQTGIVLNETADILNTAQQQSDLDAFYAVLANLPDTSLTAMQSAVSLLGSAVLGYLLATSQINNETAFQAGMIEELFQTEKWGLDPATESKHTQIKADLQHISDFLAVL